jgi:hypothetical protein
VAIRGSKLSAIRAERSTAISPSPGKGLRHTIRRPPGRREVDSDFSGGNSGESWRTMPGRLSGEGCQPSLFRVPKEIGIRSYSLSVPTILKNRVPKVNRSWPAGRRPADLPYPQPDVTGPNDYADFSGISVPFRLRLGSVFLDGNAQSFDTCDGESLPINHPAPVPVERIHAGFIYFLSPWRPATTTELSRA